jgi:hypothetical protein
VLPFLAVLTVTLIVVTYVPSISTYLPSLIKSQEEMGTSLGGGYIKLNDDIENEKPLPEPPPMDDLMADEPTDGGTPDAGDAATAEPEPGAAGAGAGEQDHKALPKPKTKAAAKHKAKPAAKH